MSALAWIIAGFVLWLLIVALGTVETARRRRRRASVYRGLEAGDPRHQQPAFQALRAFITEQLAARPDQVLLHSELGEDFGLDGDDAAAFFEAFFARFAIDPTGFELYRYFGPEGLGCLFPWPPWRPAPWEEEWPKAPIMVADLLAAVERGRWSEHSLHD